MTSLLVEQKSLLLNYQHHQMLVSDVSFVCVFVNFDDRLHPIVDYNDTFHFLVYHIPMIPTLFTFDFILS